MKTLLMFIAIAGIVCLSAGGRQKLNFDPSITIQCVDDNCKPELLNQSVLVIESRLEDYGIEQFEVQLLEQEERIRISWTSDVVKEIISALATSPGYLQLCETADISIFNEQVPQGHRIYEALEIQQQRGILAYSQNRISDLPELDGVRLSWSKYPVDGKYILYLLQQECQLSRSNITEVEASEGTVYITLDHEGARVLKKVTSKNLEQIIALLIDDEVYFAPEIRSVISDGKIQLSGDWDKVQSKVLLSILRNDILPLKYEVR